MSTQVEKTKKPFDKKKWRTKKYSNKQKCKHNIWNINYPMCNILFLMVFKVCLWVEKCNTV